EPAVGGTTLELRADLDPGAEYDLLLLANAKANPGPDGALIARAHFRASIYRGPAELLDALGFGSSEPSARLPLDMLVSAPVPTTPVLHSDAGLEQALADLGLDPWPLPAAPRTVAIWQNVGGTWKLSGLLVEADEPLEPD